jgi:hypothetical protein
MVGYGKITGGVEGRRGEKWDGNGSAVGERFLLIR